MEGGGVGKGTGVMRRTGGVAEGVNMTLECTLGSGPNPTTHTEHTHTHTHSHRAVL